MPNEQVLIVGRTRMGPSRVCVGGLTRDGENIRLMDPNCNASHGSLSHYQLGEIWEISYEPCGERRPPHIEDVAVSHATKLSDSQDIVADIDARANVWQGDMRSIFDGFVNFTANGSAYIAERSIPPSATGFWRSTRDLHLEQAGASSHYAQDGSYLRLRYVGFETPIETIPAGTVIRVSLARWWKPDNAEPGFEERCYGQLSGWY